MVWLKRGVTFVLLAFVAASVVTLVAREFTDRESALPGEARVLPLETDVASGDGACRVVACYFHNKDRCATCLEIEQTAREAVEENFPSELADGRLTWIALNMEEAANRPYIDQFDLAMPTLVVVRVKGGAVEEWEPLSDTWGLVRNAVRLSMYVTDHVRRSLEACR
ncbi:MAG: nitrophenyl compound nitroreductase subunit ArsF family protein [Candidatus Bipolaricaulis sp.]|nr:nitrophenyl compound nitroreductase subunit ArsF family protein [Candidatus Bipolaricaulis sp.]